MRIIAGSKKGMKLFCPRQIATRPITDRVKESLFNVLFNYGLPHEQLVADLFCGVGSLGLEALSRGARFVTFIEKDQKVAKVLEKNIKKGGFVKQSKVIKADAFKVGAPLVEKQRYSLVFVDPPYAETADAKDNSPLGRLLQLLCDQVTPDALVVVRTYRDTELARSYGKLEIIERRTWGTMALTFLRIKGQ